MKPSRPTQQTAALWVLSADKTGSTHQCLALAQALGLDYKQIKVGFKPWVKLLVPALMPRSFFGLDRQSINSLRKQELPQLIILSGARLINLALYIKVLAKKQKRNIKVIYIHKPSHRSAEFDAVIAPFYDRYHGKNAITIDTALSHLDEAKLEQAAKQLDARFQDYPRPLTLFMLGGKNRAFYFVSAAKLSQDIANFLFYQQGAIMLVASRRTPKALLDELAQRFSDEPRVYIWQDGQEPNPYLALLHLSQACIVSADSANMIAEAIAAGKACAIYHLEPKSGLFSKKNKFSLMHEELIAQQAACWFSPKLDLETYPKKRLDDKIKAIEALKEMIPELDMNHKHSTKAH